MKKCPYCAESILDDAIKCRYCGEFLSGAGTGTARNPLNVSATALRMGMGSVRFRGVGMEYKSSLTVLGLPLVHIASGVDPVSGRPRVARGVFAVGNIALGVFAFGGIAMGGFTFGGLSVGLLSIGGLAVGGIAFGGMALGAFLAVGGMAVSLAYAVGGGALAPCALGGGGTDPACFQPLIERILSWGFTFG